MDDRRGLEADAVAAPDEPGEHGQVLAPAGGGAGAQRHIEPAQLAQRGGPDRHVGAVAEAAGRVQRERAADAAVGADGVDGGGSQVKGRAGPGAHPVGDRLVAAQTKAPVVALQRQLSRRLQLAGDGQAGDARLLGMAEQPVGDGGQPAGVDDDVVVSEGDDLAAGDTQPAVAGGRDPGMRLPRDGDAAEVDRLGSGRAVVDDDHLVARVVELRQ